MLRNVSANTVQDWFSFCRDICIKHYEEEQVKFVSTDVNCEVQIDESIFGKKRKYHKGKTFSRFWVFGITDQKNHKCYIEVVQNRTQETLEDIIISRVTSDTNTTIVSDGWSSYAKLKDRGFNHKVVIHEREFINEEGFQTNSVESIWSQLKAWINSMHGLNHLWINSYFKEFMYRYNNAGSTRGNCFKYIVNDIARFYKV